ncbi:Hypothetical protein FKW44_008796, partial [Caligus rogercresseyi]
MIIIRAPPGGGLERKLTLLFYILLTSFISAQASRIELDSDGGYHGVTIKIREDVPSNKCSEILHNLQ